VEEEAVVAVVAVAASAPLSWVEEEAEEEVAVEVAAVPALDPP
jgi:hypothetical protein